MKANTQRVRARRKNTKRTGKKRNKVNVMPVVVKTNPASPEVAIPAVLKNGQDPPRAVISVEVRDRGNAVRKRAALIPIKVEDRFHTKGINQHLGKRSERKRATEGTQWSDPITNSAISATRVAEGMVLIIRRVALTAIDMAGVFASALFFIAGVGRIPSRRGGMIQFSSAVPNRPTLVRAA